APASLLDIAPTLLELAGADPLPSARGQSLLPVLTDPAAVDEDRPIYVEVRPRDQDVGRMIRQGRRKQTHYHGHDRPLLCDLETDPHERTALGADPAHAAVRDALLAEVRDGWCGERVTRRAAIREREFDLIRRWRGSVKLGESEQWRMPAGSNRRED